MHTRLTEIFDITHPIVLAPMGGVAGGALAAATTRAGGLGLIGCGYGEPRIGYGSAAWINDQFDLAADAAVGAGFITWSLAERPQLLDLVLARGADPIFFSFGDPSPYIPKVRDAGRRIIVQVTTLAEAREAKAMGADVIAAQGTEAGGHGRSARGLFTLLPAVADAVWPTPVLAAGGISDGRGLAAALTLGADGALLGTRLFATREALGSETTKDRLVVASGDDTVRTRVFDIVRRLDWPDGYTGRAIKNAFTDDWHGREDALAGQLDSEVERYRAAVRAGDPNTTVLFAGEGLDLIDRCGTAADVIAGLVAEAEAMLPATPPRRS